MSQRWSDWRARLRWWWKIMFLDMRRHWVSGSPDHTRAASWKEKEREKENRREMTKEAEEHSLAKNKQKILKCGRKRTLLGGNDGFQKGGFRLVVSTTLLSTTSWSATWTSARNCTPMSCCQVARPCSKGLVHDEKMTAWLHPQWRSKVLSSPDRKHSVSILPSFSRVWISKGEYDGSCPTVAHRTCFWAEHLHFRATVLCGDWFNLYNHRVFTWRVSVFIFSHIELLTYMYFSFVLLDIAAMWWLLCFIVSKKKKAQARIIPRRKARVGSKKEKARKKLIFNRDFQPLKHLKKNEQAMLGNWSSSQCLDDSWTQVAGWKSARAHTAWGRCQCWRCQCGSK